MKILMLCDFYNEKLEFQENILTKYYTKYNHEVVVIASTYESVFDYYNGSYDKNTPQKVYFDKKAKIIKLPYKFNILNKLRKYTSIKKILEDEKPDLIYVHDIMLNILECVTYIKRNPHVKMIMDYHADYSNSGKNWLSLKVLHGIIRKWYLDKSIKYISKIFPVVPAGVDFLHEIYKVPYEKMEVLPLGADIDLCKSVFEKKELHNILKEKYFIKDNTKVVITGGKLSPRKKTELLIEAFKSLNIDDKVLLVIGDSSEPDMEYIQMLKEKSKSQKNIIFTGWLSTHDVYAHYAISDIAVFPASQSILWQQAIASGLPLIVGNTGHQSIEYLNMHENIIMMKKEDIQVETIKNNIEKVLDDKDLYSKMHKGALLVRDEKLDWNRLMDKTLRFINGENDGK